MTRFLLPIFSSDMIVNTYQIVRIYSAGDRYPTKSLPPSYEGMMIESLVIPLVNAYIVNAVREKYPQR